MALNHSHANHKELSFLVLFSGSKSDDCPEVHPIQQAASIFAEAVEQRTNGEVTIKVHAVDTLYTQKETLEKTTRGIVDMCMANQGILDKYVNVFALAMMPFIFDGYKHVYSVLDGPFKDWVSPLLEQRRLVFLANWEWGFRNVTNNVRAINSPDDIKGLKLRAPLGEQDIRATMEACDATVTEIDLPDVYAALKQGTIDGQENPLEVIYCFKLYEVQKYLSLTRHVYSCMTHVISLNSWRKLQSSQQDILIEESQNARDSLRKTLQDQEARLLVTLKEKGMEIISRPDIDAFRAVMDPAYKRIAAYAGQENAEKFLDMVKAARK
jgi:TRAP-type transport system periplasmic protein